jgi:hypothetical protein
MFGFGFISAFVTLRLGDRRLPHLLSFRITISLRVTLETALRRDTRSIEEAYKPTY